MAVDVAGGASVSVSGVEAGVGAVDVGSNSYCAAFGGGGEVRFTVMKLSAIELVTVFVGWDIFGGHGEGGGFKVGMFEGVDSVDAGAPVESEEFFEERDGTGAVSGTMLAFSVMGYMKPCNLSFVVGL